MSELSDRNGIDSLDMLCCVLGQDTYLEHIRSVRKKADLPRRGETFLLPRTHNRRHDGARGESGITEGTPRKDVARRVA